MTASRIAGTERPARPLRTAAPEEQGGWVSKAVLLLTGALLVARLVTVTEGAVLGESLWIAQGWPLVLVLWCLSAYARGAPQVRLDWVDGAAGLLVLGQVSAALVVLATDGDQRAAVNMLWEWVALGLTFLVLRQILRTAGERQRLILLFTATTCALAGLGVWQHFVWYGERIAEYSVLQKERDELERTGRPLDPIAASNWDWQYSKVQGEYARRGIPWDGAGRHLWEERLQRSTEPFGMFALANSLGGVLLTGLMLLLSGLLAGMRAGGRWTSFGSAWGAAALLAYCLLLTKSRTSFVGFAAGAGCWGLVEWSRNRLERKRVLRVAGGSLAAVLGLVVAAGAAGGLDRFVLSESGKSLRYRLEYWTGTLRVISSSPGHFLIGVGPGNLRQHYLQHKLPESSEEVADPHNLFLDVWANGGLLALAGLLGLCAAGAGPLFLSGGSVRTAPTTENFQQPKVQPRTRDGTSERTAAFSPLIAGAALGYCAVFVSGGAEDLRLPVLLGGWLLAAFVLQTCLLRNALPVTAGSAAFVALVVHLLGAGGIAMPAICQTFLMLVAWMTTPEHSPSAVALDTAENAHAARGEGTVARRLMGMTAIRTHQAGSGDPACGHVAGPVTEHEGQSAALRGLVSGKWALPAGGLLGVGLFLGCWYSATGPVMAREAFVSTGDYAFFTERNVARSLSQYRRAVLADPLSAGPLERLANASFQVWINSGETDPHQFAEAIDWQRRAIERNPRDVGPYRQLAEMYRRKFKRSGQPGDARGAAENLVQAAGLYPNNASLQAELAEALAEAADSRGAMHAARRSLELDRINQAAGHTDKYLSPAQLRRMQQLAADEPPRS